MAPSNRSLKTCCPVTTSLIIFLVCTCIIFTCRPCFADTIDKIAAVVNNTVITDYEVKKAMSLREKFKTAPQQNDSAVRQEILEKLIDEAIFNQLIDSSKIEIKEDDLAKAIANVLHRNRMSLEQLKNEIASKGISYEDYKKQMEREIRRVKFVNQVIGPQTKITDQDMRDFYQGNQERFRGGRQAHIAEIILPTDGITTQAEFDKLGETAMSIVSKARHGTNFTALAKEHSKGPNAAEGGDMGTVNLKDLSPQIADAVRTLKTGEVSNPILTQNAVIIVKVVSLPEISAADFDKYRDDIYEALYDTKMEETLNNYLQKERQKAFVEIR